MYVKRYYKGVLSMSTETWHLPSASAWSKTRATAAANLKHPLTELRVETRSEALCELGKLEEHVFR